ncbi:MAG: tRNA (guanine-N7)-methyltransferase [Deltaproteobacteria bacterium]|jgi:tRNA (guanine-N7-)-methyltransferase|nr:tRNA (guanine-N7)-methyltransferase [Deltaproteobacteria bacterium]MBW2534204.1 tRNA (guanine-N7)-methyltransferase [Deltaproteobacteria bacterium]
MSEAHRPDYPYAVVPELPEGDSVELDALLPGAAALELEIGPGRGSFLLERCAAEPHVRILGIEVRRKWARIVDDRLKQRGFGDRARVVCHDARQALPRLQPGGAVSTVFFHFPDPWWKKRHRKRLVVVGPVLDQVSRLLRPGGELFIQTDVPERADEYEAILHRRDDFEPAGDRPSSCRLADNPYGARSNREHRAAADGLPVYRLRFTSVR